MPSLRRHPLICVVNESTVLDDEEVVGALQGLQDQITLDFAPRWNLDATLLPARTRQELLPNAWWLVVADTSDVLGALGYHETTDYDLPIGYVFAKTDAKAGLVWTVTASHELLEMLADPFCTTTAQIAPQQFVAYESADAVQDDQYAYERAGALVSDFMLPSWFVPGSERAPYDFQGVLTSPLELAPGGYIGCWTPDRGWHQETHGDPRASHSPRFQQRVARASRVFEITHRSPRW